MNAFTPKQLRALKRKLDRRDVHSRTVDGRQLDYIEGWFALAEANAIFGFAGWDRHTVQIERVFERSKGELTSCSYVARVRITVRAGDLLVMREGTGCGSATAKSAADAHERAIKTAETDATKRALSTFGNRFGLSLYAKDQALVSGERASWPLYDSTGQVFLEAGSPEAFCGALRQVIEKAPAEELPAWRDRNSEALGRLRKLDALRSANGGHYADILERLITARLETGSAQMNRPTTETTADEAKRPGPSHPLQASKIAPGGRIDKSALAIGTERRQRDKAHLKRVAAQPCLICARQPSHAHHLKFAQTHGLGQKVSDEFAVPLCAVHHDELHRAAEELAWWQAKGIDPLIIAAQLWRRSTEVVAQPS